MDLEKQYEKSKPLVNLVDNMVKLGGLYRNGQSEYRKDGETVTLDRYEFNQRMQEKKFLQEERKQWDRVSPNHLELKVNYIFLSSVLWCNYRFLIVNFIPINNMIIISADANRLISFLKLEIIVLSKYFKDFNEFYKCCALNST